MKEALGISDLFFVGASDEIRIDDKHRITVPKKIQVQETPEELVLVKGSVNAIAVLGLFAAIPKSRNNNPESERAILALSRVTKRDAQGRVTLSEREVNHLGLPENKNEVVVIGLGLSAIISSSHQADNLLEYYAEVLKSEGQNYHSSGDLSAAPLPLLDVEAKK